ncbi:hypothetical protein AB0L40_02370 [Patulibacter sp. NPDC049589]|uniref:hypothetical protein n=1 Tax=Patulibacter sp. NPDC049589 TaxID=3154731 RepID=UPI0034196768
MVAVIALLTVAIALGFVLLALVDRQSNASAEQRTVDAAQTLAEGALASTANILARDGSSPDWAASGCQRITGSLTGSLTPTVGTGLAARVETDVRAHFRTTKTGDAAQVTDYLARAGARASWSISLCPTLDSGTVSTDASWTDAILSRTTGTTGTLGGRRTMWLRAQADVRPKTTGSTGAKSTSRSRAVAGKVQQGGTTFHAPLDYAFGAGQMSTDLSSTVSGILTGPLLGGVTGALFGDGAKKLIEDDTAKVGLRCGLLDALSAGIGGTVDNVLNLNLCVGGVLTGVTGLTNSLGLGALNNALGIAQYTGLDGYTMAPPEAIDAYRASSPILRKAVVDSTVGDVKNPTSALAVPPPCLTDTEWSTVTDQTVVYIDKVGSDGEKFCNLGSFAGAGPNRGTPTNPFKPKIFIVARGGVRITGQINAVVYALNLQECGDDGVCTTAERRDAVKREVVHIQRPGTVTGAVWADGARGQVGIYPGQLTPTPGELAGDIADQVTTPTTCASSGLLGGLLGGVTSLLNNVLSGLGNAVFGGYEYRAAPGSPTACDGLNTALASLDPATLIGRLTGSGVPVTIQVAQRKRVCGLTDYLFGNGAACDAEAALGFQNYSGTPSGAPAAGTANVVLPNLLGPGGILSPVSNLLTGLQNDYTGISRNEETIIRSGILLPDSASVLPGTFRNVPPSASLVAAD